MNETYSWNFPLPRTHTGMLQGNGTMGAMIWGEGGVLRITIGRADFWDHRGGMVWNEKMSFATIRESLDRGDEDALWRIFSRNPHGEGEPNAPSVLPIGRLELDFGANACLTTGELALTDGTATVWVERQGERHAVRLTLDMTSPVLAVELPAALTAVTMQRVTAWNYVGDYLRSISFSEPELFDTPALAGWVQQCPADPSLCLGYRRVADTLYVTTAYGDDPQAAGETAAAQIAHADVAALRARNTAWWDGYWQQVPAVSIPNDRLQFLYNYGMYKFAGLTNPDGVPATLQGPWIEEYQMPPWSSDYHFNINVQMCYWPAYHGNCLAHLKPLFEMVASWQHILQENARMFLGIEDGLMLPHAVDDRCTCMGGFWPGTLDHGCTGWIAQMMYRYYRYTMDRDFLRDIAYPFMVGAMRVFEAMLDRDGDRFTLPVSVSPEYRSPSTGRLSGRNASFQLACMHRLSEDLLEAAEVLGEDPRPIWREIQEKLPQACLIGEGDGQRIAIWEGTPLEESHRHHSHLAGITPFDTFDVDDPEWRPVVTRSLDEWMRLGTGLWTGWCVPWAAMIHLRFNQGGAAELLLESWQRVFTNEGHGTLHDAGIPGFTLMGQGYANQHSFAGKNEVMQIEAGMSCTAAIMEMLLHTRRGVTYIFTGTPRGWKDVSFGPMRTDGAFLVSAERQRGVTTRIQVESPAGGVFRLANPWATPVCVRAADGRSEELAGSVLEIQTTPGEVLEITAAASAGLPV